MTSKEKLTSLVSALEITGEAIIKKDVVKQYKGDIEKDLEKLCKIRRIYNKSQKEQNNYSADDAICDIGGVLNDK